MSTQTHDLHRSLLRPYIIHALRAAGFASTKPSVLDTLVNLAERYMLLLASTAASCALNAHNDPLPTLSDVRVALLECGALTPVTSAAEEGWREVLRRPVEAMGEVEVGGRQRVEAEGRKREEEDLRDLGEFLTWFDGGVHAEIKRVAGMTGEGDGKAVAPAAAGVAAVGVGGGVVLQEDFLEKLKKKQGGGKTGAGGSVEEGRLVGTVLGKRTEEREGGVLVEGGPVRNLREWRPNLNATASATTAGTSDAITIT